MTNARAAVATAVVLALVFVPGCADEAPGTGPSTARVAVGGQVRDYRTGLGLAGVSVVFDAWSPRLHLTTTTDASGAYEVQVSSVATFEVRVNDVAIGTMRVHGPGVMGALYANGGTCSARYGMLYDNRTLRPVPRAAVAVGNRQATSDARGWYLLTGEDCPPVVQPGGTTFMSIAHPDYEPASVVVGRGFQAVMRHDLVLTRK